MAAAVLVGCVAAATGDGSDKNKPVPELTITGTVAVGARVKAADVDVACGTSTTPRTIETDTMGVYSLTISGAEAIAACRTDGVRVRAGFTLGAGTNDKSYTLLSGRLPGAADTSDSLTVNVTTFSDVAIRQSAQSADGTLDWIGAPPNTIEWAEIKTNVEAIAETIQLDVNPIEDMFVNADGMGSDIDDRLEAYTLDVPGMGTIRVRVRGTETDPNAPALSITVSGGAIPPPDTNPKPDSDLAALRTSAEEKIATLPELDTRIVDNAGGDVRPITVEPAMLTVVANSPDISTSQDAEITLMLDKAPQRGVVVTISVMDSTPTEIATTTVTFAAGSSGAALTQKATFTTGSGMDLAEAGSYSVVSSIAIAADRALIGLPAAALILTVIDSTQPTITVTPTVTATDLSVVVAVTDGVLSGAETITLALSGGPSKPDQMVTLNATATTDTVPFNGLDPGSYTLTATATPGNIKPIVGSPQTVTILPLVTITYADPGDTDNLVVTARVTDGPIGAGAVVITVSVAPGGTPNTATITLGADAVEDATETHTFVDLPPGDHTLSATVAGTSVGKARLATIATPTFTVLPTISLTPKAPEVNIVTNEAAVVTVSTTATPAGGGDSNGHRHSFRREWHTRNEDSNAG